MIPRIHRALVVIVLLATSCTSAPQRESASLPPVTTTTSTPTTTTQPPTTTTTTIPEDGPDVIAWLADPAAGGVLAAAVFSWEGVANVEVVSGPEALEEFTVLFAEQPELVAGVNAGDLPASLRIELTHPSFLADVPTRLRFLSEVEAVTTAVTPDCNAFPDWNVVLFVQEDRDLTRLRNALLAVEGIDEVTIVGRQQAFAEYTGRFTEAPDLAGAITVQDMAVSLRSRTDHPVALTMLPHVFEIDPGVKGLQVFIPGAPPCR